MTGIVNTLGILINGEPGLGNPKFVDYFAHMNIVKDIYKINMSFENLWPYRILDRRN